MACNDTLLPIEIEAVKSFLSRIQDLRKDMLEALMGALREGKTLLDGLKELANEGTLDSRPDTIKDEANHGVFIFQYPRIIILHLSNQVGSLVSQRFTSIVFFH